MDYLPIFFNIRNRPGLIVGGGEVAARKTTLLLQAGAKVSVVAPALCPALQTLLSQARIVHVPALFSGSHLKGCALVIAATDDPAVNTTVSALCQARAIPVNVVDQPALCSFIMPAIIERSPILIAVSTGGSSPVLARLLRARLEALIPAGYGRLARFAAGLRDEVKRRLPAARRKRFWETILQGPIAEQVLTADEAAAQAAFATALNQAAQGAEPLSGELYLLDTGSGEPDLLTVRALRLLQQADVVIYDQQVAPAIVELSRRDAEKLSIDELLTAHCPSPQDPLSPVLVSLVQQGKQVVVLKGAQHESSGALNALRQAGVGFQVAPGAVDALASSDDERLAR